MSSQTGMSALALLVGFTTAGRDCKEEDTLIETLDKNSGLKLGVYTYATGGVAKTALAEKGLRRVFASSLRTKRLKYVASSGQGWSVCPVCCKHCYPYFQVMAYE